MSEPSVFPKNWNEPGADVNIDWRIQYYYRDPNYLDRYPKGKLCIVKGMNQFKTLQERREVTKTILKAETAYLLDGWNPIRKIQMINEDVDYGALNPHLPFIDAFRLASKNLQCTDYHLYQLNLAVNRLEKAASKLRMRNIAINDLTRRQLKEVLNSAGLTPKYFNKVKGYISSLFSELIEEECCDTNLARDIRRKKVIKETREVLSPSDLVSVMEYLKQKEYNFWRYAQIFMYSGARSSELMALQLEDVNLKDQEFTVLIKKGDRYKKVKKVILTIAMPLWEEVCSMAKPKEYLFSTDLQPGKGKIRPDQITKRWKKKIKDAKDIKNDKGESLTVTADFYALKHAMLDSLPKEVAMKLASHTNLQTTSIYRVNQEKRDREELKKLRVV